MISKLMNKTSKISLALTEFMAGHPKLVAVALSVGVTFAIGTLSTLVAIPHEAFARAPVAQLPTGVDVARHGFGH